MKPLFHSRLFCMLNATLILVSVLGMLNSQAQGFDPLLNPKIQVKIDHPPGLGIKVNKVVFNPARGNCADQIIDAMIGDFVSNGVDVMDRENLRALLAEHNFSLSGFVDKNSAVTIGKIIGPAAMITVKVLRCYTEVKDNLVKNEKRHNDKTNTDYTVKQYIARTSVFLKVSIQTTDLTTGRIFTAMVLEYAPVRENKSYDGKPEPPSEIEVQEFAFFQLTRDVHRMFFAWTEASDLYFMDDKDGGLREAFKALDAGNIDQAFTLSKNNLVYCKTHGDIKEKVLAHAYYNMGMMHFIRNEYDDAIAQFLEAQKLRPGNIVSESISECRKAKELAELMLKVDENAAVELEQTQQEEKSKAANLLTNDDIIDLTTKKLSTNLILQKIRTSDCKFDTSADELVRLTQAGVADEVMMLMMEKK